MALCEAFRRNAQLQQFVLSGVSTKNKELGRGSYGSVEEVLYQHRTYAGKKLYANLINIGNDGADTLAQKFLQECQLMSSLRHPNITLFIGICFFPNENLPLLIMEKLEQNLDDLLENTPNLPLSLKCSVLEDVASGLLCLHKMEPPIVHRDLTARNVLLTASFVAKISDLGNARIIGTGGRQKLTTIPGTPVYMPPEAEGRYGPPLDIFSFGHLSLYAITQVFPQDLLQTTYTDPDKPTKLQARTELERRKEYTDLMELQIKLSCPKLDLCVKQCLHNDPSKRPSSERLLLNLQNIAAEVESKEKNPVKSGNIFAMATISKELMEENKTLKELTTQQEKRTDELKKTCKQLEDEKEILKQEYESRICAKAAMLTKQEDELKSQTMIIRGLLMKIEALQILKPFEEQTRSNTHNNGSQEVTAKVNDTPELAGTQKESEVGHSNGKQKEVVESQEYHGSRDKTNRLSADISAGLNQHLERCTLSKLEDHLPNEDEKAYDTPELAREQKEKETGHSNGRQIKEVIESQRYHGSRDKTSKSSADISAELKLCLERRRKLSATVKLEDHSKETPNDDEKAYDTPGQAGEQKERKKQGLGLGLGLGLALALAHSDDGQGEVTESRTYCRSKDETNKPSPEISAELKQRLERRRKLSEAVKLEDHSKEVPNDNEQESRRFEVETNKSSTEISAELKQRLERRRKLSEAVKLENHSKEVPTDNEQANDTPGLAGEQKQHSDNGEGEVIESQRFEVETNKPSADISSELKQHLERRRRLSEAVKLEDHSKETPNENEKANDTPGLAGEQKQHSDDGQREVIESQRFEVETNKPSANISSELKQLSEAVKLEVHLKEVPNDKEKANDAPTLAGEQKEREKKHGGDRQTKVIESQLRYRECEVETNKLTADISAESKQGLDRGKLSEAVKLDDHSNPIPNEDEKQLNEDVTKHREAAEVQKVVKRPRSYSNPMAHHVQPRSRFTSMSAHPSNYCNSDRRRQLFETGFDLKPNSPTHTLYPSPHSETYDVPELHVAGEQKEREKEHSGDREKVKNSHKTSKLHATTSPSTCYPVISAEPKQCLERRELSESAIQYDYSEKMPIENEKVEVTPQLRPRSHSLNCAQAEGTPQPRPRSASKPVAFQPQPKPRPASFVEVCSSNCSKDHTPDERSQFLEAGSDLKPNPSTRTSSPSSHWEVNDALKLGGEREKKLSDDEVLESHQCKDMTYKPNAAELEQAGLERRSLSEAVNLEDHPKQNEKLQIDEPAKEDNKHKPEVQPQPRSRRMQIRLKPQAIFPQPKPRFAVVRANSSNCYGDHTPDQRVSALKSNPLIQTSFLLSGNNEQVVPSSDDYASHDNAPHMGKYATLPRDSTDKSKMAPWQREWMEKKSKAKLTQ